MVVVVQTRLLSPRHGFCRPHVSFVAQTWIFTAQIRILSLRCGPCRQIMDFVTQTWILLPRPCFYRQGIYFASPRHGFVPRHGLCHPDMGFLVQARILSPRRRFHRPDSHVPTSPCSHVHGVLMGVKGSLLRSTCFAKKALPRNLPFTHVS